MIYWKKPEKASTCFILGIVSLAAGAMDMLFFWIGFSSIEVNFLSVTITVQVVYIAIHAAYIAVAYRFSKPLRDIS